MSYFVTEGNAVADSTLRETGDGTQVANVVIRVDQRLRNSDGTYSDGPTTDYEVTVWGKAAEAFVLSARRGARVVAAGELSAEQYTAGDGSTRSRMRITAEHHGISSRYAPAANTRRNSGQ
jgi:single-strand DNA-binding protein